MYIYTYICIYTYTYIHVYIHAQTCQHARGSREFKTKSKTLNPKPYTCTDLPTRQRLKRVSSHVSR